MTRSNYTYSLEDYAGRQCIVIEDKNLGSKSVTNDIENVIDDIARKEKIDPKQYMIVYRDSDGIWDGWVHDKQTFISLDRTTWPDAVTAYIRKQIRSTINQ